MPSRDGQEFCQSTRGWGIDWSFFFEGIPTPSSGAVRHPRTTNKPPVLPQPSYRIDTELVDPLCELPGPIPSGISKNSLALRNLFRGLALQLPSGQSVARVLGEDLIPDDELWVEEHQKVLNRFPRVANNTPLWFYILKEAERTTRNGIKDPDGGRHHLGPVGGRIVAEVLVGLAYYDERSCLRQARKWKPCPPVG